MIDEALLFLGMSFAWLLFWGALFSPTSSFGPRAPLAKFPKFGAVVFYSVFALILIAFIRRWFFSA